MSTVKEIPIRTEFKSPETGELAAADCPPVTVIEPRSGWRLVDWRELVEYRDLFRFLVWRSIKVRYGDVMSLPWPGGVRN